MTRSPEPRLRPRERHALSWIAVGTMLTLTAIVVAVVWMWRGDGTSAEVGGQPTSPAVTTPSPVPSPTEIPLPDIAGIPEEGTSVLVVVEGRTCWRGFVGGTEIENCGKQLINLTAVPNKVKAGAQLKEKEDGYRLEVYIVHEGEAVAFGDATFPGQLVEVRANLSG